MSWETEKVVFATELEYIWAQLNNIKEGANVKAITDPFSLYLCSFTCSLKNFLLLLVSTIFADTAT